MPFTLVFSQRHRCLLSCRTGVVFFPRWTEPWTHDLGTPWVGPPGPWGGAVGPGGPARLGPSVACLGPSVARFRPFRGGFSMSWVWTGPVILMDILGPVPKPVCAVLGAVSARSWTVFARFAPFPP